jgi:hypothetical protein
MLRFRIADGVKTGVGGTARLAPSWSTSDAVVCRWSVRGVFSLGPVNGSSRPVVRFDGWP